MSFQVTPTRAANGRRLDPVTEAEAREMRRLRDEENLTTREIARRLERSPSAVKAHLSSGGAAPSPASSPSREPHAAAAARNGSAPSTSALAELRSANPDLSPLIDEVSRLAHQVDARQQQPSGAVAELREVFSGLGVHAGLCTDENCTPCRMAAHELVMETRRQVAQELEDAAEEAGLSAEAERLAEALENRRAKQRSRVVRTDGVNPAAPAKSSVDALLRGETHVSSR